MGFPGSFFGGGGAAALVYWNTRTCSKRFCTAKHALGQRKERCTNPVTTWKIHSPLSDCSTVNQEQTNKEQPEIGFAEHPLQQGAQDDNFHLWNLFK